MFKASNNGYTREWLMGALGYTSGTVGYRTVNDLQYEYYAKFGDGHDPEYLTTEGTESVEEDKFPSIIPYPTAPVSYLTIENKLTKWRTALATGTAQAVILGDSISEGNGTSNRMLRWQTLLQRSFSPSGPIWPFSTAYPPSDPGWPVTREGSVAATSTWGLGWRTGVLEAPSASVTWQFEGTSCAVMYSVGPSTGVMSIQVDGGAPVVVDTNSATAPPVSSAKLWKSPSLADGTHTVVVSRHSSSNVGHAPYVQGLLIYRGDEESGVRFLDSAHSGYSTADMTYTSPGTTGRVNRAAAALAAAGGADLAIIAFGTNDYGNVTPQEFHDNTEGIIAGLRAGGGLTGSVVLLNMYKALGRDDGMWRAYGAKLAEIAAGDADISYFDLRRRMPDVPNPYNDPAGLGLFRDGLHPNDAGHAWIARVMIDYLSLRA